MAPARRLALLLPLPLALALTACPDPARTAEGPGGTPTATATNQQGAGDGAPSQVGGQGFTVTPGEGVFVRGSFDYAGEKGGRNRIDFVTIQQGAPPNLVYAMTLEERGPWQVEVPKDFGPLYILAFIDQAEDGPSPGDPATPMGDAITVGATDVEGIELKLVDTAETTGAPGGGGPGDAAAPPPGAEVGAPTPPATP